MTEPPSGVSQDSTGAAHWETVYTTKALTEVSWFEVSADTSLRLIGSRPGAGTARAVDVGAGTSTLADSLVEAGWGHVTALDVSATALDVIRQRIGDDPRASYVVSDILTWQPRGRYDLWHDRAVLHFLTDPADRAAYVALAARTVTPGGTLVLGGFAPEGPTHCSGLPVARRTAEQLAAELGDAFTLEHAETQTHHTPAGGAQLFTWVRLRR
jgi:trans-aconitate methyltransferase